MHSYVGNVHFCLHTYDKVSFESRIFMYFLHNRPIVYLLELLFKVHIQILRYIILPSGHVPCFIKLIFPIDFGLWIFSCLFISIPLVIA